ncbi:hypothetical protein HK102_009654, partial [Quaeritorhiza haematococci]
MSSIPPWHQPHQPPQLQQLPQMSAPPIAPPPEELVVIDKMAAYIAKNPPEFADMLKERQRNNPKFRFLFPGGEHHEYFQWKVFQLRATPENAPGFTPGAPQQQMLSRPPGPATASQTFFSPQASQVLSDPRLAPHGRPSGTAFSAGLASPSAVPATPTGPMHVNVPTRPPGFVIQASQQPSASAATNPVDQLSAGKQPFAASINVNIVDINQFLGIIEALMADCSQANIQNGKTWIFDRCTSNSHFDALARFLILVTESRSSFSDKLHLMYLVNDVLYHSDRKQQPWIKEALYPQLAVMLRSVYRTAESDASKQEKITKLLNIWQNKRYFDAAAVDNLRISITSTAPIPIHTPQPPTSLSGQQQPQQLPNTFRPAPTMGASVSIPTPTLGPPGATSSASVDPPGVRSISNPSFLPSRPPDSIMRPMMHMQVSMIAASPPSLPMVPNPVPVRPPIIPGAPPLAPSGLGHVLPLCQQPPPPGPMAVHPPEKKYHELPAGLMVPLVQPENPPYTPIKASLIKIPSSRPPPTAELLAAVEDFYRGLEKQREQLSKQKQKDGFEEDEKLLAAVTGTPGGAEGKVPDQEGKMTFDKDGWEVGFLDEWYQKVRVAREQQRKHEHKSSPSKGPGQGRGQGPDPGPGQGQGQSQALDPGQDRDRNQVPGAGAVGGVKVLKGGGGASLRAGAAAAVRAGDGLDGASPTTDDLGHDLGIAVAGAITAEIGLEIGIGIRTGTEGESGGAIEAIPVAEAEVGVPDTVVGSGAGAGAEIVVEASVAAEVAVAVEAGTGTDSGRSSMVGVMPSSSSRGPEEPARLDRMISEKNKGYQMLKKLGWSGEGVGLGSQGHGISEPVRASGD